MVDSIQHLLTFTANLEANSQLSNRTRCMKKHMTKLMLDYYYESDFYWVMLI